MKIKVPFKRGAFYREKEVEFLFNIGSLECASEEILKCDLWEIEKKEPIDVNIAILYGAYLTACRKNHVREKFNIHHAAFWVEHMSSESQKEFLKAVQDVMGKMKGNGEKKK